MAEEPSGEGELCCYLMDQREEKWKTLLDRPQAHEFCIRCACFKGNPAGLRSNPSYSTVRAQHNAPLLGVALGQLHQTTASATVTAGQSKEAFQKRNGRRNSKFLQWRAVFCCWWYGEGLLVAQLWGTRRVSRGSRGSIEWGSHISNNQQHKLRYKISYEIRVLSDLFKLLFFPLVKIFVKQIFRTCKWGKLAHLVSKC